MVMLLTWSCAQSVLWIINRALLVLAKVKNNINTQLQLICGIVLLDPERAISCIFSVSLHLQRKLFLAFCCF